MYVFLPAVMYFLFALLLIPRGKAAGWMAPFSLLVYILHPWVIVLVRGAARAAGLWGPLVENSVGHYLAVCLGTAAATASTLSKYRAVSLWTVSSDSAFDASRSACTLTVQTSSP